MIVLGIRCKADGDRWVGPKDRDGRETVVVRHRPWYTGPGQWCVELLGGSGHGPTVEAAAADAARESLAALDWIRTHRVRLERACGQRK